MQQMVDMGEAGSINPSRVVLVASLTSEPIKRLVKHTDPDKLVNMTYGYPQRSILVFDNGTVVITKYPPEKLAMAIRLGTEVDYDEDVPF